jgi:hypothetical protein
LLDQGSVLSRHGKTLLPNYDVFDERRYFTPAFKREPAVLDGKKLQLLFVKISGMTRITGNVGVTGKILWKSYSSRGQNY